jgi:hypothetical protein
MLKWRRKVNLNSVTSEIMHVYNLALDRVRKVWDGKERQFHDVLEPDLMTALRCIELKAKLHGLLETVRGHGVGCECATCVQSMATAEKALKKHALNRHVGLLSQVARTESERAAEWKTQ